MPQDPTIPHRSAPAGLNLERIALFRRRVYDHYREAGRDLPWRATTDPYRILVSEVMLQQTQVDRVLPRYLTFLAQFPDPASLAAAPLTELLAAWQGLGYNRRALNLQRAAREIVDRFAGVVPTDPDDLATLPGIGPYTAGAIAAFAANRPTLFIETNIRAVFLHEFFPDRDQVTDRELLPLVAATLDPDQPREWYNALMDLGAALKKTHGNPARRSRHHSRQSPFVGSDRQLRGQLLKLLVAEESITAAALARRFPDERLPRIVAQLISEGFITQNGRQLRITR